jgi:hypothetical protein
MTRKAHRRARRRPASRHSWVRVIARSANGVPARPLASAPISRNRRSAPRGRARSTCAEATLGERSNFISARTAAPRNAEVLPDLIGIAYGAFPDPSMPRPTLSVWETTRHPWVTFDHQLDRFTVQPKIDDLDLERPSHGGANVRNGKVCVSDGK